MCFCEECVAKRLAAEKNAKPIVPIFSSLTNTSSSPFTSSFVFSTPTSKITIDSRDSFAFEGSHENGSTMISFKRSITSKAITNGEPVSKKTKYINTGNSKTYGFESDNSSSDDELEVIERKRRELKMKMLKLDKKRTALKMKLPKK